MLHCFWVVYPQSAFSGRRYLELHIGHQIWCSPPVVSTWRPPYSVASIYGRKYCACIKYLLCQCEAYVGTPTRVVLSMSWPVNGSPRQRAQAVAPAGRKHHHVDQAAGPPRGSNASWVLCSSCLCCDNPRTWMSKLRVGSSSPTPSASPTPPQARPRTRHEHASIPSPQ